MYRGCKVNYSTVSDNELIEYIIGKPINEEAHNYFFNTRCTRFLDYIATKIAGEECAEDILGEFYEFVSQDDWAILRKYRSDNNASLNTYLSTCAVHYFLKKKRIDGRLSTVSLDSQEITDQLELFASDEENNELPVWQAYEKLNERDRQLLQSLVLEEKSTLEAADEIWGYVRSSEKDWKKLPQKRVQNTISMMKHRALFMLMEELRRQMTD
ncbi:MAG: sigma-70 family RNA polymerase sigma factor [Bacteroidaceae bacterium]|nr:sigma-70 family RNA polymerase sigma factor [Bacteroidaceae bacterium]